MLLGSTMPPIVAVVGSSGSGKTTIIERLVPELKSMGLRVGTIKHHLHDFDIDDPGKDSWRHKRAGAERTMISSPHRIGIVMDVDHDYALDELASFLSGMDIIVAEGYKKENKPKVEIFRAEIHPQPLCLDDGNLIALVTEADLELSVPRFLPSDIRELARFLVTHFNLKKSA
jgi:molybdopterin-guanine dinucleotide biosynthesis protein B